MLITKGDTVPRASPAIPGSHGRFAERGQNRVRVGPDIIGENGGFAGDNSDTALEEPIGFLKEIRYTKLLRSQRDGTWVITRDKNDWSCIPFRSNPFRDIESATVRQFVVHHVDIKRFLFDGCESVGNRLTFWTVYFSSESIR